MEKLNFSDQLQWWRPRALELLPWDIHGGFGFPKLLQALILGMPA
jgi:hypothetical protein